MSSKLAGVFKFFSSTDKWERRRFFLLSLTFFLLIAAYTLIRDLKNSIFVGLVGKDYIPATRIFILALFIPAVLLYSKFVDKARRYYLLIVYAVLFAVICFIFSFFIADPNIGIGNTNQSPYRIFAWLFYLYAESFRPFVLSVFWAFANSVNTPESAKNSYGLMVSSSKLGGMFSAGLAWLFLSIPMPTIMSDAYKHKVLLLFVTLLLLLVPLVVTYLMKTVPGHYLHGYEAAYQVEKERGKAGKSDTGIFAGLKVFFQYPYVLGIFSIVFFYEVLATVLSLLRLKTAEGATGSIAEMSAFLFKWVFFMQMIGFFMSFLGTNTLLRRLGVRTCLLIVPILMGIVAIFCSFSSYPTLVMLSFTLLKSVSYAFADPVREALYIPTLKEIKFKSKSWIDAFGNKIGKAGGSSLNWVMLWSPALTVPLYSFFTALIIGSWFLVAFLMGRRFDKAVNNNETIGLKLEDV